MKSLIGSLVGLTLLAGAPAQAGWSFTKTVRNSGAPGAGAADVDSRVQIEGGDARMDFSGMAENPMFGKGSYMLLRGAAPQGFFFVDPGRKTYSKFDPEAMGRTMAPGAMGGEGSAMQMKVSDASFEKLVEEPGGDVQGYATTHYRYRTRYTMTIAMANMEMPTAHEILEDVWIAAGLDFGAGGLGKLAGTMGGPSAPPELEKLSALARQKEAGFALRSVRVDHSQPKGKGMMARMTGSKEETVTTTTEVVDIRQAEIPATTFAIPAGYTETQMMQPGAQAPNLED